LPGGPTGGWGGWGGILKTDTSAGEANSLLTVGTAGSFLTAAGTPNSVGELILNASSIAHDQNGIIVNATITNNGAGPVAVVKSGNASALLAASNSYTNGTYINSGRLQTNISGGYGLGPVHVATGGQAFLEAGVHSNNFFIAGSGLGEPRVASGRGALRLGGNGANLAGKVTLINDAQIGGGIAAGNGGVISGQITGPFKLEFNSGTNGVLTLTNPLNNWTGHTIIGPGVLRIGGSGEVIPNGSRQEVILNGDTLSGALSVLDLNGSTETISGLSSTGDNSRTFIRNSAAKPATLKVGFPSTKYAFGGVIEDGSGPVALTIVSNGVQTLSGANRYSGPTIIENGILHLGSSQALPISTHVRLGHIHSSLAQLDLGGFHPIVSRLSSNLLGSGQIINSAATPSVLTVTEGIHFSGTIVGSIALTLLGGHHSLEGPNFYTGPTTVHGGALYVSGSLAPTGDVFVNRGATLGGTRHALNPTTGRVGNLTMQPGSILDPGELFTISNLTISGAEIRYTFGSEGYSERVNVVSTASFNGPSTIFLDNARPGSYALLTADTLLGIPPTLDAPTGTRMTFALNFDTQGDQIRLIVGGSASKSLTWTGANGSAWGVNTTANWTDGAVEEKFFNLDVVRFQDGPTNRSIVVNTTVNPEGVIVDNSAGNDYAISGTGTIGDSDLQGDGNIYKSGSGTLMLGGSTTYNGALLINAGLVRTTGSIAISKSVNIDNEGAFAVEGTATVGEIIGVPNGVVTVGDGAASAMLTANDIRFGSLSIAIGSSAVIRPNGGPGGTSVLNNLAIAGTVNAWTAALDLNNNDAIVRSSAANKAADFARLYNQVKQGFNNGAWTGLGITSGTAATNPSADTGLAVVDNALLGYTDFSGQRATADSILVKYTYYGDIDLNGQVNADDLTVFANNFGRMTGATQVDGDIDFNGAVNADDLTVFANNFNKGVGNPLAAASVTAVPEPGSCVLVLVGVALCFLFLRNGRRSSAY